MYFFQCSFQLYCNKNPHQPEYLLALYLFDNYLQRSIHLSVDTVMAQNLLAAMEHMAKASISMQESFDSLSNFLIEHLILCIILYFVVFLLQLRYTKL